MWGGSDGENEEESDVGPGARASSAEKPKKMAVAKKKAPVKKAPPKEGD